VTNPAVPPFVLASASASRLRVLRDAGIEPEVAVSGVDESVTDDLDTAALVAVLAERKATVVAGTRPDALVLGCDSMLDLGGVALGKPETAEQAASMWHARAGRPGTLYTGHCLIHGPAGRQATAVAATTVRFGTPSADEIAAYVATGEPLLAAGGFTIEGFGAPFVAGIDGDPSNVLGLSMPLLRRLLAELGVPITGLWRPR
jgi:septum formation protein